MHSEKIEHTVKVDAEGCCCTSSGSWCKFSFFKSDKSNTVSLQPTPKAETKEGDAPESAVTDTPKQTR